MQNYWNKIVIFIWKQWHFVFLYPRCLQPKEVIVDMLANMFLSVEIPEVSEDCLYLNIYTPAKPGDDTKLPVSVWSEFHWPLLYLYA